MIISTCVNARNEVIELFMNRLLKAKMVANGVSNEDVAAAIGIDSSTFSKKLNGTSDFKRTEIQIIRSFLNLSVEESESIFFAQ